MFVFLKKDLPKEKIEELLRILNWLAAPIGTPAEIRANKQVLDAYLGN